MTRDKDRPGDLRCQCRGYGCTSCMAKLPEGVACRDCFAFTRFCRPVLSRDGSERECDYIPSRYVPAK